VPILIRPVREQLEHDRVIRVLQAKWKRKFDAQINPGEERGASVKVGTHVFFPDLVLYSVAAPKRLQGVVEVETGESVNNLEAMAQWANFGKTRVPFQLYVPAGSLDIARRLCAEHQVVPAEVWTYIQLGDQIRFTLAERNASTEPPKPEKVEKPKQAPAPRKPAKPAKPPAPAKTAKPAKPTRPTKAVKPGARRAAPAPKRPAKAAKPAKPAAGKAPARKGAGRSVKRR
jgi:outer membrane biosynthesis protein TonB